MLFLSVNQLLYTFHLEFSGKILPRLFLGLYIIYAVIIILYIIILYYIIILNPPPQRG